MSTDSSNGQSGPQPAEELKLTHRVGIIQYSNNVVPFRSKGELQEWDFTDQDLKDLGIAPPPR